MHPKSAAFIFCLFAAGITSPARAESVQQSHGSGHHSHGSAAAPAEGASDDGDPCGDWAVFDYQWGMCRRLARPGETEPTKMIHGNAFVVATAQSGARQSNQLAAPNWMMLTGGQTIGQRHFLDATLMLTAERWTLPDEGYPLLGQIGEHDADGSPYIDAQHPHSSPVMGFTISDTISLGYDKNYLRLFAAPRGESTDGPIPFMHRLTAQPNPDAPLGHHIGQDVGHISSSVVGSALKLGAGEFAVSAFHGAAPSPTATDMPLGKLDSLAARYSREFGRHWLAMASIAYVKSPEDTLENEHDSLRRYSASIYLNRLALGGVTLSNSAIYGLVSHYQGVNLLTSWADEILLESGPDTWFSRLELVERAPGQLAIAGAGDPFIPRPLTSLTLGYERPFYQLTEEQGSLALALGASVSQLWLPTEFQSAYSGNPWTGRVFLRLSGGSML